MSKKLIINTDDFGLTRGVNYGILDSFQNESISAASLMINTPGTHHAIELMKQYQLKGIGIHINITLGKPISPPDRIPSLINESGEFHNTKYYVQGNRVIEEELIREFDAQIQYFIELTGEIPDHINYHHIYDFYDEYPNLFDYLVKHYNKPMRLEKDYKNYPYQYVKKQDLFMNLNNNSTESYFDSDLIEIPCHIGYVDSDLMEISSLNTQRSQDYQLANNQSFKDLYKSLGYELVGWSEIERRED